MASKGNRKKDDLHLTAEEAESMGVEPAREEPGEVPVAVRELPMHEQVFGELTEDDVVEAFTGEVTAEGREDVEEAVGDLQEDTAEEQGT
jgi:hypothetical protein